MYHPYFRGKQFELITIRETAKLIAASNFIPIIEPVRETLSGLDRALQAISDAGAKAIVIVNPYHGDHADDGSEISSFLDERFPKGDSITAGIFLDDQIGLEAALAYYREHQRYLPTFVHAGFLEPKALAESFGPGLVDTRHVFFEKHCKNLYRKHFSGSRRILLRDGFLRRRNADYPPVEEFSELHVTFTEVGMDGFGDFLIVGDDFSEGGGPAYAVAIHLTFIDPEKEDVMYIYHFVSTTKDTPTDPAGKFGQALDKLIAKLDSGRSHLLESSAIGEFREMHKRGSFPGLGYVKKLSMKHHIETLADFFARK